MERLTQRLADGQAVMDCDSCRESGVACHLLTCRNRLKDRLAEYEDAEEKRGHHTIEVPCKVGDKVWCIRERTFGTGVAEGTVSEIYFTDDMRMGIVVRVGRCCARGEWGKRIFGTKEEAEAESKRRREAANGTAD